MGFIWDKILIKKIFRVASEGEWKLDVTVSGPENI